MRVQWGWHFLLARAARTRGATVQLQDDGCCWALGTETAAPAHGPLTVWWPFVWSKRRVGMCVMQRPAAFFVGTGRRAIMHPSCISDRGVHIGRAWCGVITMASSNSLNGGNHASQRSPGISLQRLARHTTDIATRIAVGINAPMKQQRGHQ